MSKHAHSHAVAEVKQAPLAVFDEMPDFEQMEGAGQETATADDFSLPFVSVIQALSPQLKKTESAYIKGAEEGMLFNSVSNELYAGETGIEVIPCYFQHIQVEFKLRENGGGLVAIHPAHANIATTRDAKRRDITEAGTQLVNTMQFYCLVRPAGSDQPFERAVLSFKSTQLKKARRWNAYIGSRQGTRADGSPFQLPMFSHVYIFTTAPESNNEGSWYGWKWEMAGRLDEKGVDRGLVSMAFKFYQLAKAGEVKAGVEDDGVPAGGATFDDDSGEAF